MAGVGCSTEERYAFGITPPGVSLSTTCGNNSDSFCASTSLEIPVFAESCCISSGPSAWCS